jgi:hypothetical protein
MFATQAPARVSMCSVRERNKGAQGSGAVAALIEAGALRDWGRLVALYPGVVTSPCPRRSARCAFYALLLDGLESDPVYAGGTIIFFGQRVRLAQRLHLGWCKVHSSSSWSRSSRPTSRP